MSILSQPKIIWPAPGVFPELADNEAHVWAMSLDVGEERMAAFALTLSTGERERAGRFHFERDRNRFIAGRGWLRAVLGRYLGREPGQLIFKYGAHGKPTLAAPPGEGGVYFNLAHSGAFAVIAATLLCHLGVDVEEVRDINEIDGIAGRFFSSREVAALKSLPVEQKAEGFFNLWTRKEAWLKATGEGIGESLGQIEVSLLPDEPARLISLFGDANAAAEWTLRDLKPAVGFKGALAIPQREVEIRCWKWPSAGKDQQASG